MTEWRTDEQTGIEVPVRGTPKSRTPAGKITSYLQKAAKAAAAPDLTLVHLAANPAIEGAINIHDAWTITEEPDLFVPVIWHDGQKTDCRAGLLTTTEAT